MTDVHGEFVEYSESLKGSDEKEYTNPMDRPPVWESVWKNPRGSWQVERDAPTDFYRIRMGLKNTFTDDSSSNGVAGAVAVGVKTIDNAMKICVVKVPRRTTGLNFWEIPRGNSDPDDIDPAATGVREFVEETGYSPEYSRWIGNLWADNGLVCSSVAVVLIRIAENSEPLERDKEISDIAWMTIDEIKQLIKSGEMCDGLSISAFALAAVNDWE